MLVLIFELFLPQQMRNLIWSVRRRSCGESWLGFMGPWKSFGRIPLHPSWFAACQASIVDLVIENGICVQQHCEQAPSTRSRAPRLRPVPSLELVLPMNIHILDSTDIQASHQSTNQHLLRHKRPVKRLAEHCHSTIKGLILSQCLRVLLHSLDLRALTNHMVKSCQPHSQRNPPASESLLMLPLNAYRDATGCPRGCEDC
jgi:hypothetical protein